MMRIAESGWARIPEHSKEAVEDAMRTLEHSKVRFVLMVFPENGVGAILSNITPEHAISALDQALAAARAGVEVDTIEDSKSRPQ
jgi:hypothetical protein